MFLLLFVEIGLNIKKKKRNRLEHKKKKKKKRLEHKMLIALVYVRYNTRLRERSLQMKQNIDPILVDELDSDYEWIIEKEDPLVPPDLCWLEDN